MIKRAESELTELFEESVTDGSSIKYEDYEYYETTSFELQVRRDELFLRSHCPLSMSLSMRFSLSNY